MGELAMKLVVEIRICVIKSRNVVIILIVTLTLKNAIGS